MNDPMTTEFDTVAGWTLQVALDLGPEHHLPAACRGSGSPAALQWLLDALAAGPADRLLDWGAGMGGPAAFAVARAGVADPVCADPQPRAVAAARRLFGLAAVRAGDEMPFRTGAFDVVWALGVLCTVSDQPGLLAGMRRVLRPHGRWGLLVFVARTAERADRPWPAGNHFPTEHQLHRMLSTAGLRVEREITLDRCDPPPPAWAAREAEVEAELRRRHGDDPRWQQAARQAERIGDLLAAGDVVGTLLAGT